MNQLISQVSSSDGDENEQNVHGLCAFVLGICVLYNDDQNETFTTYVVLNDWFYNIDSIKRVS